MNHDYDAIVIGARCAGSPAAMLLARKGYKVLLVDRATFPSDTISTHLIHPPGVNALQRWGLLDRVVATGCPPIATYQFDMGPFVIRGTPASGAHGSAVAYAPRRTVLDRLLVDAASEAGAEVREGFVVDEILMDDGRVHGIRGHANGGTVTERARVVVGADGVHSMVARAVKPETYNQRPELLVGYYSYWSGVPLENRFEAFDRPRRAIAAWPTNDGLTLIVIGWPYAEFETNKRDVEGAFMAAIDLVPELAARVRAGRREERYFGMAVPNFFRKPFGPGWALAGDAGYNRDFITAQGISDAFLSAEACTAALDEWFSGRAAYDAAMARYQSSRDDRVMALFHFTLQFAALEPPPPETQQLMAAVHGNQEAMNGFARVISGEVSPADFFSEENVGRIFAGRSNQSA
jgi:2-polyprenyl-6-methoxyphenol hydroxylase-like FAD-dependent oxidoreductase